MVTSYWSSTLSTFSFFLSNVCSILSKWRLQIVIKGLPGLQPLPPSPKWITFYTVHNTFNEILLARNYKIDFLQAVHKVTHNRLMFTKQYIIHFPSHITIQVKNYFCMKKVRFHFAGFFDLCVCCAFNLMRNTDVLNFELEGSVRKNVTYSHGSPSENMFISHTVHGPVAASICRFDQYFHTNHNFFWNWILSSYL